MTTALSATVQYRPFRFEGLARYSRPEAALCNWLARVFPGAPEWRTWIADALGAFLERPAGVEIELVERSAAGEPAARTHTLAKDEITIGREKECDICLALRSVGRRHARILRRGGGYCLEDLGTALGTHVNGARIEPGQPRPLVSGDEVTIFPHTFKVDLRSLWARDAEIDVHAGQPEPMSWRAFAATAVADRTTFRIDILPGGAAACLEASRLFLDEFLDRALLPLGIARAQTTDAGFYNGLCEPLAERAGRDIGFPLQLAVGLVGSRPAWDADRRGVALPFAVRVLGITGAFRLFVGEPGTLPLTGGRRRSSGLNVTFRFAVSRGYTDLTAAELATVERSDVLLFEPRAALLFPNDFQRGWGLSNLEQRRLDNYFEGEQLTNEEAKTPEETATAVTPDFSQLPVRVHVVVGEKEMTLSEASTLAAGAIVELDATASDPVRLAVNGRIIGEGRLVEVEGRLGVRITGWKGAA
jgi:type III secretion system YscQ/HrcQ family protein